MPESGPGGACLPAPRRRGQGGPVSAGPPNLRGVPAILKLAHPTGLTSLRSAVSAALRLRRVRTVMIRQGGTPLARNAPLAHLGGESSKLLFDTLAQWNHALSQTSIAGILPAANSNHAAGDDDSSSIVGAVSLDPNVVGIDLSARRPQRPTYRGPKKRRSEDEGMEVGHG